MKVNLEFTYCWIVCAQLYLEHGFENDFQSQVPAMLVCICKGVSDRRIKEEVNRGARTLLQIRRACDAGTDCGSCTKQIRQIVSSCTGSACERSAGTSN